jgi:hypothetical protein
LKPELVWEGVYIASKLFGYNLIAMAVNSFFDTAFQRLEGNSLNRPVPPASHFGSQGYSGSFSTLVHPLFQPEISNFSACSCSFQPTLDLAWPDFQAARPTPPVVISGDSSTNPGLPPSADLSVDLSVESLARDRVLTTGTEVVVLSPSNPPGPLTINQLSFSFKEGATGRVRVTFCREKEKP